MTTRLQTGMIEDGFVTSSGLAAFRSIFVGKAFILPYEPQSDEPWFLMPFGQTLLVADYPALAARYGTIYGGNGTTTFKMPDYRGRTIAAVDAMGGASAGRLSTIGGDGAILAAVGGSQTVVLTTAQLPQHKHGVSVSVSGTALTRRRAEYGTVDGGTRVASVNGDNLSGSEANATNLSLTATVAESNVGTGAAHANIQPTLVQYFCILAY